MWVGWRSERAYSLIACTVGLVIGLPWIVTYLGDAGFIIAGKSQWGPIGGGRLLLVWLLASGFLFSAKNIFFIYWASRRLRTQLKTSASLRVGECPRPNHAPPPCFHPGHPPFNAPT